MAAEAKPANWGKSLIGQREASVALMILLLFVYLGFRNEFFLTPRNLLNVGRQASVVAIVALGEALVIISRGLDLSVGSTLGLAAVAAAYVGQWSGDQSYGFRAITSDWRYWATNGIQFGP